jgi:hypothetical protein
MVYLTRSTVYGRLSGKPTYTQYFIVPIIRSTDASQEIAQHILFEWVQSLFNDSSSVFQVGRTTQKNCVKDVIFVFVSVFLSPPGTKSGLFTSNTHPLTVFLKPHFLAYLTRSMDAYLVHPLPFYTHHFIVRTIITYVLFSATPPRVSAHRTGLRGREHAQALLPIHPRPRPQPTEPTQSPLPGHAAIPP